MFSKAVALKRIISSGVEPVLLPAGFERAGKTTWVRHRVELDHMVSLLAYYSSRHIQWGVFSPEAVGLIWDKPPKHIDVGYSVVTGLPSEIHHPAACERFELNEENDPAEVDAIATGVATDMRVIEEHLRPLGTRRDLRSYLFENRDAKDRRFSVPSSLPAKIYTAAVLATLDNDPAAHKLALEAEEALQPWINSPETKRQLSRLRNAMSSL